MKNLFSAFCAAVFLLAVFSCKAKEASAQTAFADSSPINAIPQNALSTIEAFQEVSRAVSALALPSVVEVDVGKMQKRRANPLPDFDFFFFGQPNREDEEPEEQEFKSQSMGSGVIIRRDGKKYYLLTNNHVTEGADEISIKLSDERKFSGTLVGADSRQDIALVSFESDDDSIPLATLGDSSTVRTGDICFAMGNPLGYFLSVTQGIVSATGRSGGGINNISDFIQTDAAINQGNSGGPLLNIYGEVIGINTWIASQSGGSQGLGFSIPINNVKTAIDQFIQTGKAIYGWVGVSLIELADKSLLNDLGVADKKGAFVSQIFTGSPADKGGLLPGDFVIALNGKKVLTVDQLVRDVGALPAKESAEFLVIRGKKEISVKILVAERNEDEISDNSNLWPGFMAYSLTADIRKQRNIKDSVKGVFIAGLQPKTPGVTIGLKNNDVIVAVNDTPVSGLDDFYATLNDKSNKQVWFDVWRDGHVFSTVKLHR